MDHSLDESNESAKCQLRMSIVTQACTVEPVLSSHSKIDKTKILMTNGSLMKVESIAAFCNAFDLH